jgi:hypothetical protein
LGVKLNWSRKNLNNPTGFFYASPHSDIAKLRCSNSNPSSLTSCAPNRLNDPDPVITSSGTSAKPYTSPAASAHSAPTTASTTATTMPITSTSCTPTSSPAFSPVTSTAPAVHLDKSSNAALPSSNPGHTATNSQGQHLRGGDFHLIIIQGLVTNKLNCAPFLANCTIQPNTNRSQIISITETWLEDKHFDKEITEHFANYHLVRADRDITPVASDSNRLCSRGGCLTLISPDLGISHPPGYSNGNCELTIVDISQLNLTIITVYRPPPPNASLSKFKDVLNRISLHINTSKSAGKDYNMLMCGDFNFPPSIVNWIITDNCVR